MLQIQLNPFRQPMAVEDSALFLPCYSNCFLFGIWAGWYFICSVVVVSEFFPRIFLSWNNGRQHWGSTLVSNEGRHDMFADVAVLLFTARNGGFLMRYIHATSDRKTAETGKQDQDQCLKQSRQQLIQLICSRRKTRKISQKYSIHLNQNVMVLAFKLFLSPEEVSSMVWFFHMDPWFISKSKW